MVWQALIDEAREALAPDRRVRVFDVRAEMRGDSLRLEGEVHSYALRDALLSFLRDKAVGRIDDALSVLPSAQVGTELHAITSVSVANLRFRPSHAAELATQVVLGTPLSVLNRDGDAWLLVQTLDGYVGWTDARVTRFDAAGLERWIRQPKIIITARCAWAHQDVDEASDPVSDLVQGAMLALLTESAHHYQVGYPDGRKGHVAKSAAMPLGAWLASRRQPTLEGIERAARSYLGIPYLWGGTSPKALDCSGFTQLVWFQNGVLLQRDADQQLRIGTPVELDPRLENLAAGDLLFFESDNQPGKIVHVGIYLGHGSFVHASQDVHVSNLREDASDFDAERRRTLVAARRLLGGLDGVEALSVSAIPYYARQS